MYIPAKNPQRQVFLHSRNQSGRRHRQGQSQQTKPLGNSRMRSIRTKKNQFFLQPVRHNETPPTEETSQLKSCTVGRAAPPSLPFFPQLQSHSGALRSRVTRLGKFSSNGRLFSSDNFFKITKVRSTFSKHRLCIKCDKKRIGQHFG
jgi:hypothetical protein